MARWSETHDCRKRGHVLLMERGHLHCIRCDAVVPVIASAPDDPGRISVGQWDRLAFKARQAQLRREGRVA